MKFLTSILYNMLSIQDRFLRFRLSKTLKAKSGSKRKRFYSKGCLLDLSSMAEVEKQRLESEIILLLERYEYNPEKILEYIKSQGTNVYYVDNAAKVLNQIGENEGFISPSKGTKALFLSLLVNKNFSLKMPEIFILQEGEINKYYFIYHFYNWFAFKNNIAGLDSDSQNLLKKFLYTDSDTSNLQLDEIYRLKDAIKQDKASIEFVIKLCRNYDGAKQALEKLKSDKGASL